MQFETHTRVAIGVDAALKRVRPTQHFLFSRHIHLGAAWFCQLPGNDEFPPRSNWGLNKMKSPHFNPQLPVAFNLPDIPDIPSKTRSVESQIGAGVKKTSYASEAF